MARPPRLLVLGVLGLHLLLGHALQRAHDGWADDAAARKPARMEVAFVREMALQAPPARLRPRASTVPRMAAADLAHPPSAGASEPALDAPLPPPVELHAGAADEPGPPAMSASSAVGAQAATDGEGDEPGPEWPLSTRLTYSLSGNYRGPVVGEAQVEWLRRGRDYQVHLDVDLGLVTRRMSSHGRLTPQGIAPQRYDEETRIVGFAREPLRLLFLDGAVQFTSGARRPVAAGAQDAASQFVQLTWLFLTGRETMRPGGEVAFPLVLPRRPHEWRYEVVGEELLHTPMGPLAAWHLRPSAAVRARVGGDLLAEVWLAPSLQYLPVRLVIRQDADTYIDLMLKRAPLQAAPESPEDTARSTSP